jgi:NAD-specific glutamate dehydrogenase
LTQAEEIRLLEEEAALRGSTGWHLERKGRVDQLVGAGVPPVVASQTVDAAHLVHAPSILEVAQASGRSRVDVAAVFQRLGQVVLLDDLELVLVDLNLSEPWNRWAQETIEDDILAVRRSLAERVLASAEGISVDHGVEQFLAERADSVARVAEMVATLRSGAIRDTAPLLVAVRQIQNLA